MRAVANLFLVLFLADGVVSLLDGLASLLAVSPLSGARSVLAAAVMVMAAGMYLCLGIDRRLPKRIFLPLILFVFCIPLSTWAFPSLTGIRAFGPLSAAAQVALGLLPLSRFRNGNARILTMPPAMFDGPWFSLKNTLIFGAANVFVIPAALVILVLYTANSYMVEHTPGFMRLGPGGLYMTERVYRRDNRTIRLASMIHVGNKEYYDDVAGSMTQGRTIVLAEGVTDNRHLLQNRFDYGKVAGFLGLASQERMSFRGRLINAEALDEAPRVSPRGAEDGEADILRADVDISAFRPPTILFLDTIGKHLKENPSLVKALLSLNAWAQKNITPQMQEIMMDDILHRRNREVIRYMEKALHRYDTIVIPWGALHMKEIEEEVLKRGFTLQEERERVSVDFRKMLLR